MNTHGLITKRWVLFFLLFFLIWYPGSLLIVTAYEVTVQPFLFIGGVVFTPLWVLLVSFLYFRNARDDWTARFTTAIGWIALMFLFSAILVQPVYGYHWTSIINLDTLNTNWINVLAILVGGTVAHKTPDITINEFLMPSDLEPSQTTKQENTQ